MIIVEMPASECWSELAGASFGRLACSVEDQPYIIPVYFVVDAETIYSFALPGQKVEWMRKNPRVCLEIDNVRNGGDWTSVVATGHFDELLDAPETLAERSKAHQLLQQRPMWWQPGAMSLTNADRKRSHVPIFYRIRVEQLSGHRGVPDTAE